MNTRLLGLQLGLLKSARDPNEVIAGRSEATQRFYERNPQLKNRLADVGTRGAPYVQSPGIANIKKPSIAAPAVGSLPNIGMGKTPFTNPTNLPVAGQLPAGVVGVGNKPGVDAPAVPPIPPMESLSAATDPNTMGSEQFQETLKTLRDPKLAEQFETERANKMQAKMQKLIEAHRAKNPVTNSTMSGIPLARR